VIQIYTGNGKGKTTAAFGLALRAAGAGLKVYICQFLKGRYYCELASLKKLKNIKLEQFGRSCFIKEAPAKKDFLLAKKGLAAAKAAIRAKACDVLVMDELNVALDLGLVKLKDVLKLIRMVPRNMELVITGRNTHPQLLRQADLVSEVRELKHYYKKGVKARKGIEF
jgi:cob(I)alamin adenosyltransferase